jgi:2-polyprenyl-3-methyl-5-hydroxy-6-metoxy-1,4-benzoquinol methylase
MEFPRHRQPEIMDQPGLDPRQHRQALAGLRRINGISRSAALLWPAVHELARRVRPRPLRLLDLACGGGDVPIALARRAVRRSIPLEVTGVDVSPTAVEHARQEAARAELRNQDVAFTTLDVLRDPLPGPVDVVTCSLFLHHLADGEAVRVLRKMAAAAGRLVLVNDLRRSRPGYALAWAGCRLLSRSRVVHVVGPRSVAAAFTAAELAELAARAGLEGATWSRRWPQRLLMTWRRP